MTEQGLVEHADTDRGRGMVTYLDAATEKGWIKPRTAKLLRIYGVPVLVLAALAWVVAAVFRGGGPPQPQLYAEFVDVSHSSYLDVELDRSAGGYGAFSASLPEGRAWPVARVQATPQGERVVKLRYDGIGYLDSQVQQETASTDVSPRPRRRPQVVPLRLVGQVDPARHTASVDLWVNGNHHHIGSDGEVSGAEATVTDFVAALTTRDWNEVYSLADPYMRNGSKRTDYVGALASSGAATRISEVETMGSTRHSTTEAGVSYARTPIRVTYRMGTETSTHLATLVLVVDQGTWKVLSLE